MTHRMKGPKPGLARVKSEISRLAMAGTISLETTALRLGTSQRTLQRKLHEHGVSFWALVEESRFEIAAALLRGTNLKVKEIAARIGYSTPSGFARAFSRWGGGSPSDFRKVPRGAEPRTPEWREMGGKDVVDSVTSESCPDLPQET